MTFQQARICQFLLSILFILSHNAVRCQSKEQWNEQARQNLDAKNYAAAIENYTSILKVNPKDSMAYFDRAMVKDRMQDYEGAINDYSYAISIDSTNPDNFYLRGLSKSKLKRYAEAILDFNQSLQLEPENADVYYYRGIANSNLHNYTSALLDFEKARLLRSDLITECYGNSAWVKAKMHQYAGAIKDCRQAKKYSLQNLESKRIKVHSFCWCAFHKRSQFQ